MTAGSIPQNVSELESDESFLVAAADCLFQRLDEEEARDSSANSSANAEGKGIGREGNGM